ncbi:FMN-linked oxidoreductase [Obba rivulosa]|uniref:tRNA-dihydrouridine synthase n=1 Tax=Obba rivulosa TaxID=1052685 RepID=A0A8E2AJP5_9APHY|nr:FMN-linked oxidoreductase [Obba rivulosa]
MTVTDHLSTIAAPMVNQSDLPFRRLVRRYGTSLAYTQMLLPERLLSDQDYLEFHLRDLGSESDRPVVVQLCGNDPQLVVEAGKKVQGACDAIGVWALDLNLGCPQEAARDAHYGAYLLGQKDWPLVESIVSAMSHSFTVPVSTKIRLCQPVSATLDFAQRLEAAGSAWLALHARTVSARRRRQGAADLEQVKRLKENLTIPVVSNGNVRTWEDVENNRAYTEADGIMVGEILLANPCLFANETPDPVLISLEYLELCREHPGAATLQTVQTHVRHFVDHRCGRRPWFNKFRVALNNCRTVDDIDHLLRLKVQRWRGLEPLAPDAQGSDESTETSDYEDGRDGPEDAMSALSLLE